MGANLGDGRAVTGSGPGVRASVWLARIAYVLMMVMGAVLGVAGFVLSLQSRWLLMPIAVGAAVLAVLFLRGVPRGAQPRTDLTSLALAGVSTVYPGMVAGLLLIAFNRFVFWLLRGSEVLVSLFGGQVNLHTETISYYLSMGGLMIWGVGFGLIGGAGCRERLFPSVPGVSSVSPLLGGGSWSLLPLKDKPSFRAIARETWSFLLFCLVFLAGGILAVNVNTNPTAVWPYAILQFGLMLGFSSIWGKVRWRLEEPRGAAWPGLRRNCSRKPAGTFLHSLKVTIQR